MTPSESILLELNNRKRALLKATTAYVNLGHDIEVIKAEIKAFEKSLALLTGQPTAEVISADKKPQAIEHRQRGLREKWKRVFREIAQKYPDGASYSQIMPIVEIDGSKMTGAALRTQMMLYSQQGIVERVENGVFKVTDAGLNASVSRFDPSPAGAEESQMLLD
jgi:hypothetical protein